MGLIPRVSLNPPGWDLFFFFDIAFITLAQVGRMMGPVFFLVMHLSQPPPVRGGLDGKGPVNTTGTQALYASARGRAPIPWVSLNPDLF